MKAAWLATPLIVFLAVPVLAADKAPFKDPKDKISYSIGMDIGNSFKRQSIEINPDLLAKGIKDVLSGGKTLLSDDEVREVLVALQDQMRAKEETRMKDSGDKNKKEGDAYLSQNKKKDGVVTLPSGLQYKVLTAGTGAKPKKTDTVTTHYRGTLVDGTEFDSSYKRGEPATFPVGGVIPGWTEALQLMPQGSKWQLVIPSDLAYGPRGVGGAIGPNSTLVFEVELLKIEPEQAQGAGQEQHSHP